MDTSMSSTTQRVAGATGSQTSNMAGGAVLLPMQSERYRAVDEASACLDAVVSEGFQLDGFNLLGVVANPRSGLSASSSHATSATQELSSHQQQQHSSAVSSSSDAINGISDADSQQADMFSGAVHAVEYTLAQVTEQIESLNLFLEELSRQYLGDDTGGESLFLEYYYQDEEDNAAPQVPPELANLQLQDLQSYLEESGVLAHSLFAQGLETRTLDEEETVPQDDLEQQLDEIPAVFYDPNFDLTNPQTFVELLLQDIAVSDTSGTAKEMNDIKSANSLLQPTQELVPVREPDSLAGHLDRVELALQEQVRQKSTAFFHETTRFRQLQWNIEELLRQVQSLRSYMQKALHVYGQTEAIVNHQRQDYERLGEVLDAAMELVRCKASIGGLLSANDHLGAAEQIQYGRRLLKGHQLEEEDAESESDSQVLELQQLTAFSTCGDQFAQYESLVVQNLSEELVEVFFNWRPNEKERVEEMIEALQLCRAMFKTSELYQRRLQQLIRMTVRTTIAEFVETSNGGSGGGGVTGMSYPAFFSCLQMLMDEIQSILRMAHQVDEVCEAEKLLRDRCENMAKRDQQQSAQQEVQQWTKVAVHQSAELATKSIAELLRLRKEAHSLISLSEMKQLWDSCLGFTQTMEGYGNSARASSLRSTLAGQAKAFLDRTHESNMSALVAALDSERWSQCEVSAERQTALTRLCSGLATISTPVRSVQEDGDNDNVNTQTDKKPLAIVEGVSYRVVWSCLLLVEMIMTNLSCAAYFQSLAPNATTKVVELMRLFNSRTTSLVLGAGAIHSAARLKSINAKHLSYVTQCLGMITALLPHIRAALMAQLPAKQHTLLADLDTIKKEYLDHNEKVLNKFVSIIGGIVEHGLAPRITGTDFDARSKDKPIDNPDNIECCVFLDGISSSTRKLHQVLSSLLPPDHLQDVFSRIFAYLDQKIPALFITASTTSPGKESNGSPAFQFPLSDGGKHRLLLEVASLTKSLNALSGVHPWVFTATIVLERRMDYKLPDTITMPPVEAEPETTPEGAETSSSSEEKPVQGSSHSSNIPDSVDDYGGISPSPYPVSTDEDTVNDATAPQNAEEDNLSKAATPGQEAQMNKSHSQDPIASNGETKQELPIQNGDKAEGGVEQEQDAAPSTTVDC